MKKLVKEITAYRYSELAEQAREQAKRNYCEENCLPELFSEDLVETLKDKFGLHNLKTYFSLSNCQGDGLCLCGHISPSELFENNKFKRIAFKGIHYKQIQSIEDELQGIDFRHKGRDCHANSVSIDSCEDNPTDRQESIIEKIIQNVKSWYFSFCDEWEEIGYDYFYEIADNCMQEVCDANDYLFTEKGQLINQDEYAEL